MALYFGGQKNLLLWTTVENHSNILYMILCLKLNLFFYEIYGDSTNFQTLITIYIDSKKNKIIIRQNYNFGPSSLPCVHNWFLKFQLSTIYPLSLKNELWKPKNVLNNTIVV